MHILFWYYKSRRNKAGQAPLMMRITLNGKRVNFATGIEVEEALWDKDRQRVKGAGNLAKEYNQLLLQLKADAWNHHNECKRQEKHPSVEELREAVLGKGKKEHTLLEAIHYQIQHLKARVNTDIAPSTIKKYETLRVKVETFLRQEWKRDDVFLSHLSHQFVHELDTFMRAKQGLKNNGVIKNMQQLKRVMRIALNNEWMDKDPFAKYQCKLVEPKRTFLTQDELSLLESLPLPNERLSKVRDTFVFSCYTGLAYADAAKLAPEHIVTIEGNEWIILSRTKTKNESVVPLLSQAKAVLLHYQSKGSRLLPVISSQNMNRYLKEVAALAGVQKRLTFHVARHTFASTVMLNRGVDIASVSAMLGHKMIRTTQIYARVNYQKIFRDVENARGQ